MLLKYYSLKIEKVWSFNIYEQILTVHAGFMLSVNALQVLMVGGDRSYLLLKPETTLNTY